MSTDQDLGWLKETLDAASPEPWTWNQTQYVHAPMRKDPEQSHVILLAPTGNDSPDEDARLAALSPALARCALALGDLVKAKPEWHEGTRTIVYTAQDIERFEEARQALADLAKAREAQRA